MSKKTDVTDVIAKIQQENNEQRVKLCSGVTADSFQNFAAKLGVGTDNLTSGSQYGFNPISRVRTLLEWVHRGSWLGGVAIDVVADDMTRAGIEFKGELDPNDAEAMDEYATRYGVWNSINETIRWARLYGGCVAVLLIDGQDVSTPFRPETVGKRQFKGLLPLDRWMVEPIMSDLVRSFGPSMGLPKYYVVTPMAPAFSLKRIHYTRLIRLVGIKMPYWQAVMENLWGISVLERLYDRMIAFDSATTGAAQLVYKAYLRTYKIENLRETVAAGGPALQGLVNYVDMMRRFQTIEGITLMDKNDEFEGHTAGGFSGISEALVQFGQQLAGALQIPLTRLFGQSPSGMNATVESDMRMYYDSILQQQEAMLHVGVRTIYQCIGNSLGVKLPEGFDIKFKSLWQMADSEKATIAATVTAAVTQAEEAGLITRQTALQELRQSSNVTGIWTNITEEQIAEAEDEGPPEPLELRVAAERAEGQEQIAETKVEGGAEKAKESPAEKTKEKSESDVEDSDLTQPVALTGGAV